MDSYPADITSNWLVSTAVLSVAMMITITMDYVVYAYEYWVHIELEGWRADWRGFTLPLV